MQVKVQHGWITLLGEVEWQYQRAAAESAVRPLGGVVGVLNQIVVKPRVSVPDVRKRIEDALKRDAELEAHAIQVGVSDGQVTLEGKVRAWADREVAEHAAWSAPGVRSGIDHLSVA